jgi:cell division protein FtsI (penicillin-binding protein 3)
LKLAEVAQGATGADPAEEAYAVIGEMAERGGSPAITEADAPKAGGKGAVRVPEVDGLPMRRAIQAVLDVGLTPRIDGSGRLTRTDPPGGTQVPKGSTLVLVFEPQT